MITSWAKKIGARGGRATAKAMPVEEQKKRSAKGGYNRWAGMTKDEIAREMARVRVTRWWDKKDAKSKQRKLALAKVRAGRTYHRKKRP